MMSVSSLSVSPSLSDVRNGFLMLESSDPISCSFPEMYKDSSFSVYFD